VAKAGFRYMQTIFDMTFKFSFRYEKRISPHLDRGKEVGCTLNMSVGLGSSEYAKN
jgi:hypothetical protein